MAAAARSTVITTTTATAASSQPLVPDRTFTLTKNPQTTSPLSSLAPELRNRIYDLSFSSTSGKGPIDLSRASPPSKNLILTCQFISNDTYLMYVAAYQRYWKESDFTVSASKGKHAIFATVARIRRLKSLDIHHISRITVTLDLKGASLYKNTIFSTTVRLTRNDHFNIWMLEPSGLLASSISTLPENERHLRTTLNIRYLEGRNSVEVQLQKHGKPESVAKDQLLAFLVAKA